jgi:hypothetical protein
LRRDWVDDVEYVGYLRRHKEVRRPGQVKVDDTGKLNGTIEEVDNGSESLVLNSVM